MYTSVSQISPPPQFFPLKKTFFLQAKKEENKKNYNMKKEKLK